ncbi:MAG: SufD family Fe-S cluster assembly protein [Candidatus Micrarchaeota archaeon]
MKGNLKTWLGKSRRQGSKDYETTAWLREADSPTQAAYTPPVQFGVSPYPNNADAEIRIENGSKGAITAVTLKEMGEKEFSSFKEKFETLVKPWQHKLLGLKNARLENGFLVVAAKNSRGSVVIDVEAENGIAGIHGIVVLEENASLEVYERQKGKDSLQTCATEVFAGKNSSLVYNYAQDTGLDCVNYCFKKAKLEEKAKVKWNSALFGGKANITTIESSLEGIGSNAENYCGFAGGGTQVFDITTNSYHRAPDTSGNLLSKGILWGEAQSTQRGLIYIAKNAARTNCFLNGHALLLSGKAKANSIPSLEILTNDVQSRHGATVDHVDEEMLFYLQTRGLKKQKAVETLAKGFVWEALGKASKRVLKEWDEIVSGKMQNG